MQEGEEFLCCNCKDAVIVKGCYVCNNMYSENYKAYINRNDWCEEYTEKG
jgi:hypothetical protein